MTTSSFPHELLLTAPLSPLQRRLWFLQQWSRDDSTWHVADSRILRFPLSISRLQKAMGAVIEDLELLRTSFREFDGQVQQCIWETIPFSLQLHDVRDWNRQEQKHRLQRAARQVLETPFELDKPPLFRWHLWRTEDEEWYSLLVVHHILSDAESMQMLWKGVEAHYCGEEPEYSTNWQFADVCDWWEELEEGDFFSEHRAYWKDLLSPLPPPLQAWTDSPRQALFVTSGAQQSLEIPQDLLQAFRQWLKENHLTVFAGWSALVASLLCRWTSQEHIAMATPVDARVQEEFHSIPGPFVNTMVLVPHVKPESSFLSLVQALQRQIATSLDYKDFPFDSLLSLLHVEREPSRPPLAQILVQVQEETNRSNESTFHSIPWRVERERTGWELSLTLHLQDDRASVVLARNSTLFSPSMGNQLLQTLMTLLQRIVETPEQLLQALPLCSTREEQQLQQWNQTQELFSSQDCLQRIARQCRETPKATALVFEHGSMTYEQFWKAVESLAKVLVDKGVQEESLVAVCLERSLWLPVVLVAIWRTGGAYVPLLPTWPELRKKKFLEEAQPVGLLVQGADLPGFSGWVLQLPTSVVEFSSTSDALQPALPDIDCFDPERLAYVLYTSGSTGKPRGVELEHRALANRLHWMQKEYPLQTTDRVLQKTSVTFDVAGWELFWPLMVGAVEVIAPPEAHKSPRKLLQEIETHTVTTIHFVPSMLTTFLHATPAERAPSLQRIICSGEELTTHHQQQCEETLPHVELSNLYGPTEAAIDVTYWNCEKGKWPPRIPIGEPISNVQIHILDEKHQPLPPGFPGELWIEGVALARGYRNHPSATRERFVSFPSQRRLYRTGDVARWRWDGKVEYLGRLDFQWKIRGNRLEAGEVEAALLEHPLVLEACVSLQQPVPGLVAWLVTSDALELSALYAFLKERLPPYAIPAGFVFVDSIPLNSSGKADRQALPLWQPSSASKKSAFQSETEQQLAQLWAALPGFVLPEPEENFFVLGGHSLLAVRVLAEIRHRWGVSLSLQDFFQARNLRELAEKVEAAEKNLETTLPVTPLQPLCGTLAADGEWVASLENRGWEAPSTWGQQGLWLMEQLVDGKPVYHIHGLLKLTGTLHQEALEHSYQLLQHRHRLLRTSFPIRQGIPFQWVHPSPLSVVQSFSYVDMDTAMESAKTLACQPFSLANGPLLRCFLWTSRGNEHLLLLSVHHLLLDGESLTRFWEEWTELYASQLAIPMQEWPEEQVEQSPDFLDFAHWQRQQTFTDVSLEYWKEKLSLPLEMTWLPGETRVVEATTEERFRGHRILFDIPEQVSQVIGEIARQEQTTVYQVLLAALKAWLYGSTGQTDVRVGTSSSMRPFETTQEMMGFFLNTLVLRTDLSGSPSFLQLLTRVRRTVEEAFQHRHVPFEQVLHSLPYDSRDSLFRLLFVFQQGLPQTPSFAGMTSTEVQLDGEITHADWTLTLSDTRGKLQGEWQFQQARFSLSSMQQRLQEFLRFLASVVRQPAKPIQQHSLLSKGETQTLFEWGHPPRVRRLEERLEELLSRLLQHPPEHVALASKFSRTFGELATRIPVMAGSLKEDIQLQQGEFVLLQMPRSIEAIEWMLAVLYCGGAVIFLDEKQSLERCLPSLEGVSLRAVATRCTETLEVYSNLPNLVELAPNSHSMVLPSTVRSDAPSCMFLTSGTTGIPKPVVLSRSNLAYFWQEALVYMGVKAEDRVLQFASLGFDTFLEETGPTLLAGGTIVVRPEEEEWLEPSAFQGFCKQQNISILDLPTAYWTTLVYENNDSLWDFGEALHTLVLGGEVLPTEAWTKWRKANPQVRVLNTYGPTECSVVSTVAELSSDVDEVPIGKPIPGTAAVVVLESGQPAPVGVEGELLLSGPGLSLGYATHHGPFLEERSIPFSPHSRWYRTGDRAFWDDAGRLHFRGRKDRQVKLRGIRIELGEVDNALRRLPEVRDAVSWLRTEPFSRLEAAVQLEQPVSSPLNYFQRLSALPPAMRPAAVIEVEFFPLTSRGKVDISALMSQVAVSPRRTEEVIRVDWTPLQKQVAECWESLLGVQSLQLQDNFFAVGGHSLLALRLVALLRETLQMHVELKWLFSTSSLGALVEKIEEFEKNTKSSSLPGLKPRARTRQKGRISSLGHLRLKKEEGD